MNARTIPAGGGSSMKLLILLLLPALSCSRGRPRTDPAADFPLPVASKSAVTAVDEPAGALDLPTALALTLQHHPQLQGAGDLERLRIARERAAVVSPNPAVELTAEDFLGSGPFRGVGGSQWTLQVSQVLELGGKPQARARLAGTQSALEAVQFALTRLTVLSRVTLEFARLVHLQQRCIDQAQVLDNAVGLEAAIEARIAGGKDSPIQLRQYRIGLSLLRLDQQDLERRRQAARVRLSSNWGNDRPRFSEALGRFTPPESLPSAERLRTLVRRHPEVRLRQAQIAALRAQRLLEGRQAVPDIALTLGVRMITEDRNAAVVGGVSVALPIWDRRDEARDVLDAQIRTHEREVAAKVFLLEQQVTAALAEYDRRRAELDTLEKSVLPEIEANIRLFTEGFTLGKFTLPEMLDSQKALFDVRGRILDGRLALQTVTIELEFLTGLRLGEGPPPEAGSDVP